MVEVWTRKDKWFRPQVNARSVEILEKSSFSNAILPISAQNFRQEKCFPRYMPVPLASKTT